MSIKSIFGSVFFSVLAALVIYDLVVKGLLAKMGVDGYDATQNFDADHFEK